MSGPDAPTADAVAAVFRALPELETARLRLRRLRPDDAAAALAIRSDPEVGRYLPAAPPWHPGPEAEAEAMRAAFAQLAEQAARGEPTPWGLEHKADRRFVGSCGYVACANEFGERPAPHRAELAYLLARPYWGQGLMPEAVRAVLAVGFGRLGLNRIEARCEPANRRSARVLEKVGMRCEGVLREHVFTGGAFRDLQLWALLRRDWAG